jgi:hypothetical protein
MYFGSQIAENDWPITIKILSALLKALPDNVRKPVVIFFLPSLNDVSFNFTLLIRGC